MVALIPVALLLGLVLGGVAHRRLALNYKQRWLDAMKSIEDKSLWSGDDGDQPALPVAPMKTAARPPQARQAQIAGAGSTLLQAGGSIYVPGRWTLRQLEDGTTMTYQAVRVGFDPVELGKTGNYKRFGALYRRDREEAQDAVKAMNEQNVRR